MFDFAGFLARAEQANSWILSRFDWLFSLAAFGAVILLALVAVSKLGAVRIGGPAAKPILSRWSWFAITLCTTIAIGILFWGAAEPIYHVTGPPAFSAAAPGSDEAAVFALSAMFMHWTITPYALYATPALAFALAHFNLGKPYSLSGPLSLVLGPFARGRFASLIDAVGLYALVAGVAASLGVGVLTIAGGVSKLTGLADTVLLRFAITALIVAVFVASSISGIQRGIRVLSDLNTKFFFALAAFVLIAGPTGAILALGLKSLGDYALNFIGHSLALGDRADDPWMRDWTVFYFANWLAWAPITALFLGRISVGYTVREFLLFNLAAPAFFGAVWMIVFGGAAVEINGETNGALAAALSEAGPNAVIYELFGAFPAAPVVISVFILLTFVSFVTAMDSNTHSIASVCLGERSDTEGSSRAALAVKVFWGALVGAVAWVMTSTTGIDGVRMLSNLGGLPGLFVLIGMGAAIVALYVRYYDRLAAGDPKNENPSA